MANPDIVKERNASTIDTEELAAIIYEGPENLSKKRKLESAVYDDPDYKSTPDEFLSRDEVYDEAVRKSSLAFLKRDKLKNLLKTSKDIAMYNGIISQVGYNAVGGLQESMFTPTVIGQMSDEQKKKWLPLCLDYRIIGTYAQTELGHGTFVRGLETTAHYDSSTQEFVINSPTVSSTKWWPGGLGKTSNHAIVMAQLFTQGKCHGVHPFIVQIRSMEDHTPLPGITVGDIGPKFGLGGNDNGFLRLSNHRIPREHMLMRYAQVTPDGTYTKPPRSTLTYGTMTYVRAAIVGGNAIALAKGVTIAIRYSAVRRQSEMRPGEPEPQILSYLTQQHKLFPLLATAYAFHFTKIAMTKTYRAVNEQIMKGNFADSQELHALSSGLKAYTAWVTVAGLEILRMSCGGHGYSQASGFPRLYSDHVPSATYEGEHTVLMLQTARYLMKCIQKGEAKSGITVKYLFSDPSYNGSRDFANLRFLEFLYRKRAYNLVHFASSKVEASMKNGLAFVEAINSASVFLVQAAMAHSHYYIVENFSKQLHGLSVSFLVMKSLSSLCLLYMLDGIDKNSGEFLEAGILSGAEVKQIRQLVVDLLPTVRVNAVALVDAFDFRDEALHSVLGRYDGNVYENLYKWAQNSPLNKTDVHPSYQKYLAPLLKRHKSKL